MRPTAPLLLLLTLLTPGAPALTQDDAFLLSEGQRVTGICWFRAERAGQRIPDELRRVTEAAWDAAAPWIGLPEGPFEPPFVVNLYAKRRDFAAVVDGIAPGAAKGRVVFSDWGARQVHVKLQPILGERELERIGLSVPSLRNAAIELVRLAPRMVGSGEEDRAPRWLREGLAAWAAQRALLEHGRVAAGLEDPAWSTAVGRVQALQGAGRVPTVEDLIGDRPGELDEAELAALHEVFFTYLSQQPDEDGSLRALLHLCARGSAGEELVSAIGEHDAGFQLWVYGQQPLWQEQLVSTAVHGDGWVQTPIRGENAICWRTAPPPSGGYTIRGEYLVYLNEEGMGQVNIVLAQLGEDYLSVSFNTGGGVHFWRYDGSAAADGKPAFEEAASKFMDPPLPAREWVPFEIHVVDERVFVEVRGEALNPVDTFGRDVSGRWGIGTFAGCVGMWRNVECVGIE